MNAAWSPSAELADLIEAICHGTITADETSQLEQLVLADPHARRYYVRYLHLHASLPHVLLPKDSADLECGTINEPLPQSASIHHSAFSIQHSPTPLPPVIIQTIPSPPFIGGPLFSYLVAIVIFSIGLMVGAVVHVSRPSQMAGPSVPGPSPTIPSRPVEFVGRITAMVDCQWAEPSTEPVDGAHVPLGRKYALSSGLMEITYDSGVRVILQGPVTYEIESAAGGYLSVGKLTAKLEKKSEVRDQRPVSANQKSEILNHKSPDLCPLTSDLFAIRTPTALVTDLGTEFGVEVSKEGDTTSHVFRGVIEVRQVVDDGKPGQAVRLVENESVRVEKQSSGPCVVVHRAAADAAAFVRAEQLPMLAAKASKEQRLKPLRRWQAYSQELRKDPSLLAYYDFQQTPGSPTVLRNVAANGGKALDGVVENATWNTGRLSGKHALQFNGPDDCVRINVPQEADNLTLAAWVCAYSLDNPLNGILMSDEWGRGGQVHWQLSFNGCVGFSVFDSVIRSGNEESAPVFDAKRLFRWTHLAAVYDREAARIRFYADGDAMGEVNVAKRVPIRIGAARIGHWNSATMIDKKSTVRSFHGRIDELAIFGRVCSPDEIQRMFEAGKPPDDRK